MTGKEAEAERALSILVQALKKAGIGSGDETEPSPLSFGETKVFWKRTTDDIELRLNSAGWNTGKLQASIFLKDIALTVLGSYPTNDADAVEIMVSVLNYLQHIITTILPRVYNDLMIRTFNMFPTMSHSKRVKEALPRVQTSLKHIGLTYEKIDTQLRNETRGTRKRGGNTRTREEWRSESTLKQYASKVNERKFLATCIKNMFDVCEGEAGWLEDLRQDRNFQLLSSVVPDVIITWAVRRIASEDLPAREREPLSIACEIARQELELPEQSVETLRDYYRAGSKALKQSRKQ